MNTTTITPKAQSLLKSTSLVSFMTLLSRIMGFARDMVLAAMFGALPGMDAFIIAFKIPNFMRRLFAEGAFSQAFVPVLAEYQKTRDARDVRQFLSRVAGGLGGILSIVTIVGVIAAPLIIYLFAPGFGVDDYRTIMATDMLRLTFPYLMLISLTGMAGAVLNTYGYFGIPAFTPVLLNLSLIVAAVYISPHFAQPITALAWGVLAAGVVQLLFQIPFLSHRNLLVKPQWMFQDSGVRRVLKLMVPALFGVSVAQLNLLVDTVFASFLREGSVSWLYYTDRLTDFPLGVFGVAIATVILPHLSRQHTTKSSEQFSKALDWGMRLLLLIGVPSALGLVFFSSPVIASCFAYGKFNVFDLIQTQKSLITLGLGVPGFMLVKILASGFYAQQNIKTPVKVGAISMFANTALCVLLIVPLAHAGLTLASSIAGYINCSILLFLLIRRGIYQPRAGWFKFLSQLFFANTLMSGFLIYMAGHTGFWLDKPLLARISLLLGSVLAAFVVYVLCLVVSGVRLAQFRGQIKGI